MTFVIKLFTEIYNRDFILFLNFFDYKLNRIKFMIQNIEKDQNITFSQKCKMIKEKYSQEEQKESLDIEQMLDHHE